MRNCSKSELKMNGLRVEWSESHKKFAAKRNLIIAQTGIALVAMH